MEILNKYVYDPATDVLGKGGFATVYKAYDKVLDIPVALKFFQSQDQSNKYNIINEIRRAIILSHPNIVRYYGVESMVNRNIHGQEEEVQIGVMEYVQEGQMKVFLAKNPVSFAELNKLFIDILEGLKYLHAQGIIHRDIKPQNILLGRDKQNKLLAKIADFGISKNADSNQASASVLLGTIEYMAPEQFNPEKYGINKNISYNVDIWAFGVTVYFLLTGELLFGNRTGDTSAAQLINKIVSLEGLEEKLSILQEPYNSLLKKCIVPDANQRCSDIDELLHILKGLDVAAASTKTFSSIHHAGSDNDATEMIPQQMQQGGAETMVIDHQSSSAKPSKQSSAGVVSNTGSTSKSTHTAQQVSPSKSGNKRLMVAVFALIVILIGGYFAYSNMANNPEKIQADKAAEELSAKNIFLQEYIKNELVTVPAGSFTFGGSPASEVDASSLNPEQVISLSTFRMSKTEVTRYQWNTIMGDKKYPDALTQDAAGSRLPANNVSWEDALSFLMAMNKLAAKSDLNIEGVFELPSQIQWEYACLLEYPGAVNLDEVSWNLNNAAGQVHPVGTKKAGKLGIYDMLGNVFEWCQELIDLTIEGKPVQARVIRGGDFKNLVTQLDPKVKNLDLPTTKSEIIGFRIILDTK